MLNANNPGASYLWQNNTSAQTYLVSNPGAFWVKVTQNGCSMSDTITVNYDLKPVFTLGKDTTICEGMTIQLQPEIGNIFTVCCPENII